jgi:hypothetical protein
MAIFDSNKVHYLSFYVHLTDKAKVDSETAFYAAAGGANLAPLFAADQLQAPFRGYTEPDAESAPFTWTPWSGYGTEGGPYPLDVKTFSRTTGGFLGIGGTTVKYYWMGSFVLAADGDTGAGDGPTVGGVPVPVDNRAEIPKRRWLEGFETPGLGASGASGAPGQNVSRDAARHTGGMGLALRGASNQTESVTLNKYDAALESPKSWERLYVRLRKPDPAKTIYFWMCEGFPTATTGMALGVTPTGQLAVFSRTAGTFALVTTIANVLVEWTGLPSHNAWVKLDLLIEYDVPKFRVYAGGTKVADVAMPTGQSRHTRSLVGNPVSDTNDMEIDIDDWMNAEIPTRSSVEQLNGQDFLQGSKVALLRPKQFSANHAGGSWTGDFRVLIQNPGGTTSGVATIVSSTAQSLAAVDADSDVVVDAEPGSVGVASIVVSKRSIRTGAGADGRLGFKLAANPEVMTTVIDGGGAETANSVLYTAQTVGTPSGSSPDFPDATPIELRYEKGNDAGTVNLSSLLAQVELIGLFGPEDYRASEHGTTGNNTPSSVGQHNAPYPRSQWAKEALAGPIAPYIVQGGTYVGNGTGQDITFRAPVNWFFVRPLTGNTGGMIWWSTMIGSHEAFGQGINARTCDAQEDLTFSPAPGDNSQQQRYRVRIAGSSAQLNASGVTYQYVGVADPGMRYMLNGSFNHKAATASFVNKIVNAEMLPGFAFLFAEEYSNVSTKRFYLKGPGQAAATIAPFDTVAAIANALTFGTGQLTSQTALHSIVGQNFPFSLWRRSDGNKDTGEPAVVNFGSWTGDGSASRTINLAPTTGGKRPLFVMVASEAAAQGFWRDPSHTGSNSSQSLGTETALGITGGGPDQFSVGSSLNTNGVVYTYFALFAGTTECNNGWGCNGEYVPVEPTSPVDGPWPDDPPEPGTVPTPVVPLTGEPDLENTTVLSNTSTMIWGEVGGQVCEVYTRKVVNRALKHLGISKQIANLVTETSEEAVQARDVILQDVNTVLRDFPWPWATAYANLVLVGGTATVPVNKDWQYSYRAPSKMMFARRIVGQADQRRAHDPNPIKFRLGSDTTGPLIFTDEPIPTGGTLVLEYTDRITCPTFFGDPLFRAALQWKIAASLAQPLSRDSRKQEFCLEMYRAALRNAEAPAANEGQQAKDGDADWIAGRN